MSYRLGANPPASGRNLSRVRDKRKKADTIKITAAVSTEGKELDTWYTSTNRAYYSTICFGAKTPTHLYIHIKNTPNTATGECGEAPSRGRPALSPECVMWKAFFSGTGHYHPLPPRHLSSASPLFFSRSEVETFQHPQHYQNRFRTNATRTLVVRQPSTGR